MQASCSTSEPRSINFLLESCITLCHVVPVKTAVIRARCGPDIEARVKRLAEAWHLKPSDIVRLAVEHYIAVNETRPNPLVASTGVDPFEVALKMNEEAASSAPAASASPIARSVEDMARTVENRKRKPRTGS